MTGEIVGYAYDFYNKKQRETQKFIPIFAHNLFSFDFFFVVKCIRFCALHTKQLSIGGTNVQYANIDLQVKFIDTIKYYNQSLSSLAKSADENEKTNIRKSCKNVLKQTQHIPLFLVPFEMKTKSGFLTTCQTEKELFPTTKKISGRPQLCISKWIF